MTDPALPAQDGDKAAGAVRPPGGRAGGDAEAAHDALVASEAAYQAGDYRAAAEAMRQVVRHQPSDAAMRARLAHPGKERIPRLMGLVIS